MTIKITDPNDPDKEIEVFTPDEVAAKDAAMAEKETALATANGELEKERRVSAEKSDNIKRLRDMSDEEKSKLSQEQIEQRKIAEKALDEAESAKAELKKEREEKENLKKENFLERFSGGNADLRKKLEENFNIIDSGKEPDLEKRMGAAAAMAGINMNPKNPLTQEIFGQAPTEKQKSEKDDFLKGDKAAAAFKAMGISPEENK